MKVKLSNQGDTIIEVLIVLAILGIIIIGAFVSSNRSLSDVRQAQERTEALKIAENQLEDLRAASKDTSGTSIFNQTAFFCMTGGDNAHIQPAFSPAIANPMGSFPVLNSAQDRTLLPYNTSVCTSPGSFTYNYAIDRTGSGPYTFTVYVRWNSVFGTAALPHNGVALSYKLSP